MENKTASIESLVSLSVNDIGSLINVSGHFDSASSIHS
jgi:hypothetical protein